MESISKDILLKISLDLEYSDILKLCKTSKKLNDMICKNQEFWKTLYYNKYYWVKGVGLESSVKTEPYFKTQNYSGLYRTFEETQTSKYTKNFEFKKNIVIIDDNMKIFLLDTDFGIINGTRSAFPRIDEKTIYISDVIKPIVLQKVITEDILILLFLRYFSINKSINRTRYPKPTFAFNANFKLDNHFKKYFHEDLFTYTDLLKLIRKSIIKKFNKNTPKTVLNESLITLVRKTDIIIRDWDKNPFI